MARKQKRATYSPENTIIAFGIGCPACAGMSYVSEITYDFLVDNGEKLPMFPNWRAHMVSVCRGLAAFMLTFYSLKVLGRQSKTIARRARVWERLPISLPHIAEDQKLRTRFRLATCLTLSKISVLPGHAAPIFLSTINLIFSLKATIFRILTHLLSVAGLLWGGYENGAQIDVRKNIVPRRDFSDAWSERPNHDASSRWNDSAGARAGRVKIGRDRL